MTRDWAKGWAPYWNVVTAAHHLLGNQERELELASEGYQLNPDRMLMLAWNVRALAGLGRWDEIRPLLARAGSIRGPDRMTAGTVMLMGARELRRHGHSDEARACLEEALQWVSSKASDGSNSASLPAFRAEVLYELGALQQNQGLEVAATALRQARLEFEALAKGAPENPSFLGHLGGIYARLGEVAGAREMSDSLRGLDRPYLRGQHTYWRARIAALLGEEDEAVRLLWQSVGEGVPFGLGMHANPDLEPLHGFPPFEEFIRPKG
jgi:tetratricopeptide (TPR) repeat protein